MDIDNGNGKTGLAIAAIVAAFAMFRKKKAVAAEVPAPTELTAHITKPTTPGMPLSPVPVTPSTAPIVSVPTQTRWSIPATAIPSDVTAPQPVKPVAQTQAPLPSLMIPSLEVLPPPPVQPIATIVETIDPNILHKLTEPSAIPEQVATTLVDADLDQPLIGTVNRVLIDPNAALGGNIFKDIEDELKRAEQHVRKEAERFEKRLRAEAGRVERKFIRNLTPIKVVMAVAKYLPTPVTVAAWAVDKAMQYNEFEKAKQAMGRVQGKIEYQLAVNESVLDIMMSPKKYGTQKTGGTIGYLAKNRVNSAFVPLLKMEHPDFQDSVYITIDVAPILAAAGYTSSGIAGYITKIPFTDTVPLKLMYSFELLEFVTAPEGSRYMAELKNLGYIEVKLLGYISKVPQTGPETNKPLSSIEVAR